MSHITKLVSDYNLISIIGSGTFGEVWKAQHINTKKKVAIKIERNWGKKCLKYETIILRRLQSLDTVVKIKYYGVNSECNYLIMDLLNKPLNEYYNSLSRMCDRKYKRLKWIGLQMLTCIRSVHEHRIIHRDIKPSNFMLNANNSAVIIIDFGLATQYMNSSGEHRKNKVGCGVLGTLRYMSNNIHDGNEPSRRDDIISMVSVLIFLIRGQLPWQGITCASKPERVERIKQLKKSVSSAELCRHLPDKLIQLLDYCMGMYYSEDPDYDFIQFLLKTI